MTFFPKTTVKIPEGIWRPFAIHVAREEAGLGRDWIRQQVYEFVEEKNPELLALTGEAGITKEVAEMIFTFLALRYNEHPSKSPYRGPNL